MSYKPYKLPRSEALEISAPDFVYMTLVSAHDMRQPLRLAEINPNLVTAFYAGYMMLRGFEDTGEHGSLFVPFQIIPHHIHGDSPIIRGELSYLRAYGILDEVSSRVLEFRPRMNSTDKDRYKRTGDMWQKIGTKFLEVYDSFDE